jgi:hypothetical protein
MYKLYADEVYNKGSYYETETPVFYRRFFGFYAYHSSATVACRLFYLFHVQFARPSDSACATLKYEKSVEMPDSTLMPW